MVIKTSEGERNVAGGGTTALGVVGTVLGSIGTAGAIGLMAGKNGLLNNGYNNGNCWNEGCNWGRNGFGYGFGDNCFVNRYDLCQSERIGQLESTIANLNGKIYTDGVGTELYAALRAADKEQDDRRNASFREAFTAIAQLDKETAVNTAVINKNLEFLNYKIDTVAAQERAYVDGHFVPGTLKMSLCKVCPTPAVAAAVQPTPTCVSC